MHERAQVYRPMLPVPVPLRAPLEGRPRAEQHRTREVEKVALFRSKGIPDAFIVLLDERGVRTAGSENYSCNCVLMN